LVAERYLRSDQFADELLGLDGVRKHLAHLKSHDERRAWLRSRLSVSCDREKVRVRLDGPLAILRVVAADLSREPCRATILLRDEWQTRVRVMSRLRGQGRGCLSDDEYFEAVERLLRCELRVDPLEVVQAPRPLDPVR
jgi:hypothetical protein